MASQALKYRAVRHLGTPTLGYTHLTGLSVKVDRGWLGVCGSGINTVTPYFRPGDR